MLIRQTAPVFGAANPYQTAGETQVSLSVRELRSYTHYSLDVEQVQREQLGTNVINEQRAIDLTVTHALSERFAVAVGVPFISASWSIPTPTSPAPGPRAQQDARGIGDISVNGRYWLLDTRTHRTANIAVGAGVKMPTGKADAQDTYPDRNGNNNQLRYVDQSIQPGDGGWGLELQALGFKRLGRVQMFGSAAYLVNPRDTNGTPSISVTRLPPGATAPAAQADRLVNSVPDQYLVRLGAGAPLGKGFVGSASLRAEGMPRYDLLGASHGFRRPGIELFVEPGLTYAKNGSVWSVNVPIGFYRNRKPDPYTGAAGDATFPKYIILGSYGFTFGGRKASAAPTDAGRSE